MDTSKETIVKWCQQYVAGLLETPVEEVDPEVDFDRLGIDSALAVSLLTEVEERYDVDVTSDALFANPNLNAVAEYLHAQLLLRAA